MPITRLLQDTAFGPDEIAVLVAAYEDALRALSLVNRSDLATEMVAKRIIELAKQGERDPVRLRERAMEAVSSLTAERGSRVRDHDMKYRRPYEPRIVGGKVVMMPAELQRLHRYLLDTDVIEVISDDMREVVEAEWPELGHKLPRKKPHS